MDDAILARIVKETALPESSVSAAVGLIEKGATAPFIVRYRREATGGLDIEKVGLIQERMDYYRELRDRRMSLLKSLSEQGKLTDEIKAKIESCFTKVELDDLQQRFRSKKKTRLKEAVARGLQPLARYLMEQEPDAWSLEDRVQVFVEAGKGLTGPEDALRGCVDILAEWIGENHEHRRVLREMLEKDGHVISSVVPAKVGQKTKYTMYYERRESVTTIPSHRVLAIRRGCKEGILISSIEGDHTKAVEYLLSAVVKDRQSVFAPVLEAAIHESYDRILKHLIETEVRTQVKERADREAIRVFQENLANLLLSPPAGPIVTMGIDWSKDNACSVAVVDGSGTFLEGTKVRFASGDRTSKEENRKTATGDAVEASHEADNTPKEPSPEPDPPEEDKETSAAAPDSAPKPDSAADGSVQETSQPGDGVAVQLLEKPETGAESAPETEDPPVQAAESAPNVEENPKQAEPENAPVQETKAAAPPETASLEDRVDGVSREVEAQQSAPASAPESAEKPDQADGPLIAENAQDENRDNEPQAQTDAPAPDPTATLTNAPGVAPMDASTQNDKQEEAPPAAKGPEEEPPSKETPFDAACRNLKDLITRHKVQAIAIGAGARARELESLLRRILSEESLGDILIAAVNDAGIAIYSSSRVARDEFPNWSPSARCAVSLARRLQDPLPELVKIDPKLIGVGQYQHDVDQKELHRKLLRTVQYCVNRVGVNINGAGESLLRYVSGLNDKTARRIIACRKNSGPFESRESMATASGLDPVTYQQAAAFLRIPSGTNALDRTAIHPESYGIVEKMASSLGIGTEELIGNREKAAGIKLEEYATETVGLATLKDIREELLHPGRDPRKPFKLPKFRADITDMSQLKEGMALEGIVTNVTNFGAFVDIGVQQDGLVHLSQMSNRFIRDPREAVKVGDIVQVKVISVESETKRIGLSIKALLPPGGKKRKNQKRRPSGKSRAASGKTGEKGAAASPGGTPTGPRGEKSHRKSGGRPAGSEARGPRKRNNRKTENQAASKSEKESGPRQPEPSLQEKIAILQSKFRRIH